MPLGLHLPDLLILLAIALLIFGPKKLPEMGAAIGKSITSFKKGMRELEKNVQNGIKDKEVQELLEQRKSELEALEHEIAEKKAAVSAYETAQVAYADSSTTRSKLD
ncbi:MAG TPA: twin-arginine translocase TatA/TatE family subunit [Ktedonobacteraceae bacterium]|jgi:sec-independent protein translocase protein TatA